MHRPITTHATLPNLRLFCFQGTTAYLEALVCWITAPRFERLEISLEQVTYAVPCLQTQQRTSGSALPVSSFLKGSLCYKRAWFPVGRPSISFRYRSPARTVPGIGNHLLRLEFSIRLLKYSMRWSIFPSNTRYIISHRKSTKRSRSTAPNHGSDFLGRFPT